MKIASHGHVLVQAVHPGSPGDTIVVLDQRGQELGRAVALRPTGNVIAVFDPPVPLPPKGEDYEIVVIPAYGKGGAR